MSQIWRNTFPVSDSGNVDGETEVVKLYFLDWSYPKRFSLVLSIQLWILSLTYRVGHKS